MVTAQKLTWVLVLAVLGSLVGCGRKDLPELGQVHGKVTLDGKPLAGAIISFCPKEGRPATGIIAEDGTYELTFVHGVKGAKVGPTTIIFLPASETPKPGVIPIPAKYRAPSELTADIKPGDNTCDFELKSK